VEQTEGTATAELIQTVTVRELLRHFAKKRTQLSYNFSNSR